MSALRISTGAGVRLIDLGPSACVPQRGHSHRGVAVTGGSFVRPAPRPDAAEMAEMKRQATARWRARVRAEKEEAA